MLLLAGSLFLGCENQIEAPEAMTLQTRSAVEVLPAEAQFVGMVDLEAMQRNSAFNPFEEANMASEFGARIQDFIDATGFNPEQDLKEVYFAARSMERGEKPTFVAYASFDRDRLQDYVEQNMSDTFARTDYKGITVYRSTEDGETFAFALATDNMIVASPDETGVHSMLDRLAGSGESLKSNAHMMELVKTASGGSSAWFVARDLGTQMMREQGPTDDPVGRDVQQIGKAVQDVAVSVKMQQDGAEGTVFMMTKEGISASDVASLTKGVVAAMKGSAKMDSKELKMLDDIRVTAKGDQVRVNFYVDNDMLADSN